jgi:ribosomal protein S6--L-glutamate ligase
MEVNSSPGLRGIEAASGKDIAQLIIQFIEKRFESMSTAKDKSPTRTRTRGKG